MRSDIHYTSPDGLDLYARSYGPADAPLAVLCMHGLTRNHKDFEPLISKLGNTHRFIAVDVRGRGRSAYDPNPDNYTPATYAGDMAALLDQLHLKRVALIGTSMGGLMAMVMMKAMPDRILGTVLNDVGPQIETAGLTRIASYASKVEPLSNWVAAANATAQTQSAIFPHFRSDDWMAFARRTYRDMDDGRVILDYDPAISRTVSDARPGLVARFAVWRLFNALKVRPLLIVRGATSDVLSSKTASRMTRRHGNAACIEVPATGHAPILDTPPVVEAIKRLLEDAKAIQ